MVFEEKPLGPGSPVAVLDGTLFLHDRSFVNGMVVRSTPVAGGPVRELLRDESITRGVSLGITRSGISYVRPSTSLPFPYSPSNPTRFTLRPGFTWLGPISRARCWQVPLSGGAPRELIPERRASQIHVVGDTCYWVEDERLSLREPVLRRISDPPKATLYASPLAGGPHRRIAVLGPNVWVQPRDRGIVWGDRNRNGQPLLYACPPEFALTVLPDFPKLGLPAELGGRLYWTEPASSRRDEPWVMRQLVSTASDGSDHRVELDTGSLGPEDAILSVARTDDVSLYLRREWTHSQKGSEFTPRLATLLRFRPDKPGSAKKVLGGPHARAVNVIAVDQGYLYYTAQESLENWLDLWSDDLAPRIVSRLYRVRL